MNPLNPLRPRPASALVALLMSLGLAGITGCAGTPAAAQRGADHAATSGAPVVLGIHHLKFLVSDLDKSTAFYEAAFGARRLTAHDHRRPDGILFAVILEFPGLGTQLELRLDPAGAPSQKGLDPMTLTVDGAADLERWLAHFQAKKLQHSPVLIGLVGWLLVVEDPDGRRIRLYTRQTHGPELKPSWDSPWIQ